MPIEMLEVESPALSDRTVEPASLDKRNPVQAIEEEVVDFITRHILEKGSAFFDG